MLSLCLAPAISHHVRTDSRYGMKTFFRDSACSDRAEMTFPRVSKDLLMLAPSCKNLHNKNKILIVNKGVFTFNPSSQIDKRHRFAEDGRLLSTARLNHSLMAIDPHSSFFSVLFKFQNVRMKNGNQFLFCWFSACTLSRSPLVMAELQRSLPARSTRLILLVMLCSCSSPSTNSDWAKSKGKRKTPIRKLNEDCYTKEEEKKIRKTRKPTCVWVITRVKTEWDLELLSFIPVAAVARCLLPSFSQPFIRNTLYLISIV